MPKKLFKKGESGNPGGRPKVPDDIKAMRMLDTFQLERIMNKLLGLNPRELKGAIERGDMSCKEQMIARVLEKAIFHGDQTRVEFFLNRLIGKVSDRVEHTGLALTIIERLDGRECVMKAEKTIAQNET